ncbi:phosphomannomutase [Pseudoalteromonas sp. BSi20495]|uniref:phosphomannomutase n=1 Tax=Pseudoalteromonas sp. BSi20495 TaxID=386429 RepID=UPI0002315D2B|nr:phosphomannomutase [Pseudoalteromonas sp. BSi20495]GAA77711.1 phosphomannomutase [Pseudoalteromonas sp. BSi20495]
MLVSHNVISKSNITFGTSGARGLVEDFSANVCAAFTVSFIETMRLTFSFKTVAIAIDNRPSSYSMAQACASAAEQLGLSVIYYGVIPTPALACRAMALNIPSIMVTGSHIPFDRNGLKFYRPDGEINKPDESSIINGQFVFEPLDMLIKLSVSNDAADAYVARYLNLFDSPFLHGKRIGIYLHSSAGRDIYPVLFKQLGAEVVLIDRSDTFVPIDTEAVSETDAQKAIDWTAQYKLDALFSTDGDGDRPLLTDEKGVYLRGDLLCLLASKILGIEAVVAPINCNSVIETSEIFKKVIRCQIGSPYVIAEFDNLKKSYGLIAGFEANGGFMLASDIEVNGVLLTALPTRDAILPILAVLSVVDKITISSLLENLPSRYTESDRIQRVSNARSISVLSLGINDPSALLSKLGLSHLKAIKLDQTDGLRITLNNGEIVHLRQSGNAPELRCYVEAKHYSRAKELVKMVVTNLSKF